MQAEQLIYTYTSRANYSRRELKYYISEFQYKQLVRVISNHMLPDENMKDTAKRSYPVRSLYLESGDLRCFNERLDGVKTRSKYRYRTYIEGKHSDDTELFVEIKKKIDKDLHKRRARIRLKDLHETLEKGEDYFFDDTTEMSPEEIKTLNDFMYLKHKFKLSPFIGISYEREAYYDDEMRNLRVSFDRDMHARPCSNLFGLYEDKNHWMRVDARGVIFEIKTRHYLPEWMEVLIKGLSLAAEPISKYCICVEMLGLDKG